MTVYTSPSLDKKNHPPKVGIVSLGCPKALVDVERILNHLRAEGYVTVQDYQSADLVLVNSCGFIDRAKQETLSSIEEAIEQNGRVIVTGCMGADPQSILKAHPKVLAVTGPNDTDKAMAAIHEFLPPLHDAKFDLVPRQGVKLTPPHYAYIKLAEGCNNQCSFCIIPHFRGKMVSRDAAKLLYEAERLVDSGVKELLLVAQDLAAYGLDIQYRPSTYRGEEITAHIIDLATHMGKLDAWVRLHYLYPYPHIDRLIPLMNEGLILPYLDIPFQHAVPKILKSMRRPANQDKLLKRIETWRQQCPDITIRSTFIIGFPGETDEDFHQLLNWLEVARLNRVGAFMFEAVAGAPASDFANQIPETLKAERLAQFMEKQESISAQILKEKHNQQVAAIIDEITVEGKMIARTSADAPEIDGNIFLDNPLHQDIAIGDVVVAKVTHSDAHDLYGHILSPELYEAA